MGIARRSCEWNSRNIPCWIFFDLIILYFSMSVTSISFGFLGESQRRGFTYFFICNKKLTDGWVRFAAFVLLLFFMEAESCCLCSWLMQKSKDKQRETERETTTHWHNIIHLYLKNGKKTRNTLTIQTWINLIKYINNINIKINMFILDNFFKIDISIFLLF